MVIDGLIATPACKVFGAGKDIRVLGQDAGNGQCTSAILLGLSAISQQDLTTNDILPARFSLGSSPRRQQEETADLAAPCWAEDEEFLPKDEIAEWLGGQSLINKTALRHYVNNFNFSNFRLHQAFRRLCAKLYLKAETQQVDRGVRAAVLEMQPVFRFGVCQYVCPTCLVHAVSYSVLLLNTNLHVAEPANRMSRNQFVWNTMNTIQLQLLPDEIASSTDLTYNGWRSIRSSSEPGDTVHAKAKRSDSITSWNSITWEALSPSIGTPVNFSGQLMLASTDPIRLSLANQSSVSVGTSSVADCYD
ncbi:Sec7 domain-containing protein [Dichomitus squalens]|uniref:Sec7 domain-containing protein n=1 Tax=Dichomitus squalens TaxID=114155 RepID=A0A4Q9PCQ8_9APHY|nr:Sec7 domain-containing protein [Dichomitus squalens]